MKKILLLFFLALTINTMVFGQDPCSGNVPIENLANGMDYTIVSGADGNVTVSLTVLDNPAGLVGFFGGPGGIFQAADATGSLTYNFTGHTIGAPFVIDMFFNWAAGGQGNSDPIVFTVGDCPLGGGGPAVLEIPIDFEDTTIDYDLVPFGSNMNAEIGADPTDPTNAVLSMTKTAGPDCWAGVTIGESCLANPIPFGPGNMTFYMDVYSPVAGAPFLIKVEECGTPGNFSEVLALTTIANGWETLVFDFANGCANPPNPAITYSKVIVFPQFTCEPGPCGVTNPGASAPFTTESYYVDNISMTAPAPGPPALPITFDDPFTDYGLVPFSSDGGISAVVGADPADPTNQVLCATKSPGTDCWAGVTIGDPNPGNCLDNPIDFSQGTTIEMDVYSPIAGSPMLLKVEDCSNSGISSEVLVLTTVSNAWETLVFDFAANGCAGPPNPANTYNKLSIFPNFTCTPDACGVANPGAGSPGSTTAYYFDNIEFIIAPPPPPPPSPDLPIITFDDPGVDYNLNDFGGVNSIFGLNPLDATDTVVCVTKPPAADCWGGTTVGGPAGCLENPIPFTATDQTLTLDVYSPNVGTPFLLKVEDCTNGTIASEVLVLTTVANAWETLVFDFSMGCPGIDLNQTYDRVSVFTEFSCPGSVCGAIPPESNTPGDGTTVYYFDNIAFGLPYGVDIADPCLCLDNASVIDLDAGTGGDDGTFGEIVSITGPNGDPLPDGLVFEVTAITGGAGGTIAVGDLLVFNPATGHYEINFEHTDAIGYTITVDQIAPGVPTPALTISNVCAYPNPTFDPALAAQYCAVDALVTLGGTDALGSDAVSFTIDGAPATEIDPGTLALGTHLVVMTWDGAAGANDGSGTVANPNEPGCIQTVQQSIEVINDAPEITCPADVVLDCTESLPDGVTTEAEFVALGGLAAGNCSITTVSFDDVVTITNCGIEIERTYTVGSGTATTSCVQNLRTVDTTTPVISCPPALSLSCFETAPAPATTAAEFIALGGTISDDCTSDLSNFTVFAQNSTNGGDNCPGNPSVGVRTYFVSDLCGNVSSCQQTITYAESTQGPVITSVLPACYKYCASLANPMDSDVTYDTDCSFDATVNITGPTQIGADNCPGSIYRYTYTVTDDCGRTSAPVTRDFIIGNDGPTIECAPFNLLLECGDPNNQDYIDAHIATASANTSCELGYTMNHFPQNFNLVSCGSSTVVTFVATDDCGRTASCTTTISVQDNTAPEYTNEPTLSCDVIECGADAQFFYNKWINANLDSLEATDACDTNVSITASNTPLNQTCNADGNAVTTVTFSARDNCNNITTLDRTFTIQNNHPALFGNVPADATMECDGSAVTFGPAPTVTETCQTTVTSADSVDDTDPCAVVYTRTWTATDACGGLSTSVSQSITVVDTQAPVAPAAPADVNVQCASDVPAPVDLTAMDACEGAITVSPSAVITPGSCDDQFSMVRTWTFTDNCGNQSSVSQAITVNDNTAPEFTFVPADYDSGCIDDNGNVTAYAQVCASSDDAEENTETGVMNLVSSDLELIQDESADQDVEVGIRFKDMNIPAGATITGAYIQFTVDATIGYDPSSLTIDGEASDNASTFTLANGDISDRPRTNASAGWDPADWEVIGDNHGPQQTTDLTAIVQEIVDRGGYTSESAMAFFFNGTGKRTAISWDGSAGQAPQLYVTYAGPTFGEPTATDNCSNVVITFVDVDNASNCAGGKTRTWTATDGCGNTSTASQTINYSDNVPPVFTSVPAHINIACEDASFPLTFGTPTVADNCDDDVEITFTDEWVTGDEDSCDGDDEDSEYRRTWTATDNCGNVTTAQQRYNLKESYAISGNIATEFNQTVQDVTVTLEGLGGFTMISNTTADGFYGFDDLALNANYSVTPALDENPLNGVSSFDLVLISKHILQLETLDSPYKMIAADINKSGSITTMDLVELRKLILHIDENFTQNTSWRFVEADFAFPIPNNPFASIFPEETYINGLQPESIYDFTAVKIGDVNGSAITNALAEAEDRNVVGDLVFTTADQQLKAGETYNIAFQADNFQGMHGYQFTMNFDQSALDFEGMNAGDLINMSESNFGLTKLNEGMITTSWTNQDAQSLVRNATVFELSFTAKSDILLSEAISIGSRYTRAEAYNADLDLMDVQLRFDESDVAVSKLRLYQNSPNPFKQETLIGFDLPEAGTAVLNVYNGSGKLLTQIEGDYAKGYNSISLSNDGLSPGLLHYQLVTNTGTIAKKMLFSGK